LDSSADTYIVSLTGYDDAGRVASTTDNVDRTNVTLYDDAGRVVRTIQNYDNGTVEETDTESDITVAYEYDAGGRLATVTAYNAKGDDSDPNNENVEEQATKYLYDNSSTSINRGWQTGVVYPDTGDTVTQDSNGVWTVSSGTDHTSKTYDRLGRTVTSTDQRGVVHAYTYDSSGRVSADTVTSLGSGGVDGSIRRIDTDYDELGRVKYISSFSDTLGTPTGSFNMVNQIKYEYDGWGNVSREFQEQRYVPQYGDPIGGAVDESDSPFVAYTYSDGTDDWDAVWDSVEELYVSKYLRLGTVTYPEYAASVLGRSVTNIYGDEGSTDDIMSRVAGVSTSGADVSYKYLGLNRIVVQNDGLMEDGGDTGVKLSYLDSSGNVSRLDRFGRVVDQFWEQYYLDGDDEIFSGTQDRFTYVYDRAGNRTSKDNELNSALDEDYVYDELGRLADWKVNGVSQQTWSLDSLGNDLTSTSYDLANQASSGGSAYDAAGNMTTFASGGTATYDAWNRVATVTDGYYTLGKYNYDGLNRRTKKLVYASGSQAGGDYYYYDTAGRIVEDRNVYTSNVTHYVEQYIWSQRYIDSPVVCLHDGGNGSSGLPDGDVMDDYPTDWRTYYLTDANNNVTTTVRVDKYNDVVFHGISRNVYTSYGEVTRCLENWTSGGNESAFDGPLYAGYWFDVDTGLYQVRARYYDPGLSRFVNTDPIGYQGGMNLYAYCGDNPINATDPMGTEGVSIFSMPSLASELETGGLVRRGSAVIGQWSPNNVFLLEPGLYQKTIFGCGGMAALRIWGETGDPTLDPKLHGQLNPTDFLNIPGAKAYKNKEDAMTALKGRKNGGLILVIQENPEFRDKKLPTPNGYFSYAPLDIDTIPAVGRPASEIFNPAGGGGNYMTLLGTSSTDWCWEWANHGWNVISDTPPLIKHYQWRPADSTYELFVLIPGDQTKTKSPIIEEWCRPL